MWFAVVWGGLRWFAVIRWTGFRATSLSTYDFSTLYATLPHNLIIDKLINLIEWTFKRDGSPYIACNERQAGFLHFWRHKTI